MTDSASALVFDIQRFSLHDGPGIRTTVFFKGCSLRCSWCHNPEGIRPKAELRFRSNLCVACRACNSICPQQALVTAETTTLDFSRCNHCGLCAQVCPSAALETVGKSYSVDQLLTECLRDKAFADASGGGITLSGGEPVLQSSFLQAFLPQLKREGTHVVLQTAGNYSWSKLEVLLPHLDHVHFDWKLPTAADHAQHTGAGSHLDRNLARLLEIGYPTTVRMPVLAGLNTTDQQVEKTCARLRDLGVETIELLPYHRLWRAKLAQLSPRPRPANFGPLAGADFASLVASFERYGIRAHSTHLFAGGSAPCPTPTCSVARPSSLPERRRGLANS